MWEAEISKDWRSRADQPNSSREPNFKITTPKWTGDEALGPALQPGSPEFHPRHTHKNKNRAATAVKMVECQHRKCKFLRKTIILPLKHQLVIKQYIEHL
jgi:hypothetical protein